MCLTLLNCSRIFPQKGIFRGFSLYNILLSRRKKNSKKIRLLHGMKRGEAKLRWTGAGACSALFCVFKNLKKMGARSARARGGAKTH